LKDAETLGKQTVTIQTLKFTYTTKTTVFPFVGNAGIKFLTKISSGKKKMEGLAVLSYWLNAYMMFTVTDTLCSPSRMGVASSLLVNPTLRL
jgi:hypothetical protein